MNSQNRRIIIGAGSVIVVIGVWFVFFSGGSDADINSDSLKIRLEAIAELEKQNNAEAAKLIAQHAQDKEDKVAVRSLYALGRMSNHESRTAITKSLEDERETIREAAVAALSFRGTEEDRSKIRTVLQNPKETGNVRAVAAVELGTALDWDAMPLLVKALENESSVALRAAAYGSIKRMVGVDFGFKADAPRSVREPIVERIKRDWPGYKAILDQFKHYRKVKSP